MYGIGLQLTSTTTIGGSYSPASLFTANEVGYVYDLNDATTLFKDVAGTQPVTAPADPVALRLDKSRALARGPELVTNGDFSSATGWTLQTGWSISGGLLVGNVAAAAFTNATTVAIPVAGRTYQVTYTVTAVTSGSVRLLFYGGTVVSGTIRSTVGTFTELLVANSGHSGLGFQGQGAGFVGTIDNVTVKELAGNHATQSDLTKRPLYSLLPANGVRNLANGSADVGDVNDWQVTSTTNGITVTKVAFGFDTDGLPITDYSVSGTASADTTSGAYLNSNSRLSATTGQTYTSSFIAHVISGTAPPADNGVRADVIGETAPSTFIEASTSAVVAPTMPTVVTASRTLGNGATNQARGAISIITRPGVTVSYTIRIKALQFELGSVRTAYQFNYAATNIVEPPFAQVGALLYDGINDFMVTPAINFQSYTWDGQARRNFALGSAQPANEGFWPASVTTNGVTLTKIGSGFDTDGLPYVDCSVVGTAIGISTPTLYIGSQSRTPAAQGQTWTGSYIGRIISGTVPTGASGMRVDIIGETAPVTQTEASSGSLSTSTTDALVSFTYTFANVLTNQALATVTVRTEPSLTVNYIIRVKGFQFEQGSARTAWQGTGTDEVFLCHGVRKTSDTAATIAELTVSADVTNGSWGLFPNAPGGPGIYQLRSRGTALVAANLTFNAPDTVVLSGVAKISADTALIRRNGVQVSNTGDQGTGNYSNAAIYFGMRGGVSFPLKGYEFSSICRSAFANPAQIASAEEWVRQRTAGAY